MRSGTLSANTSRRQPPPVTVVHRKRGLVKPAVRRGELNEAEMFTDRLDDAWEFNEIMRDFCGICEAQAADDNYD